MGANGYGKGPLGQTSENSDPEAIPGKGHSCPDFPLSSSSPLAFAPPCPGRYQPFPEAKPKFPSRHAFDRRAKIIMRSPPCRGRSLTGPSPAPGLNGRPVPRHLPCPTGQRHDGCAPSHPCRPRRSAFAGYSLGIRLVWKYFWDNLTRVPSSYMDLMISLSLARKLSEWARLLSRAKQSGS